MSRRATGARFTKVPLEAERHGHDPTLLGMAVLLSCRLHERYYEQGLNADDAEHLTIQGLEVCRLAGVQTKRDALRKVRRLDGFSLCGADKIHVEVLEQGREQVLKVWWKGFSRIQDFRRISGGTVPDEVSLDCAPLSRTEERREEERRKEKSREREGDCAPSAHALSERPLGGSDERTISRASGQSESCHDPEGQAVDSILQRIGKVQPTWSLEQREGWLKANEPKIRAKHSELRGEPLIGRMVTWAGQEKYPERYAVRAEEPAVLCPRCSKKCSTENGKGYCGDCAHQWDA